MTKAGANLEWQRWGEVDPFYGVASWDGKQVGGVAAWTDEEFFELGERDWEDFRSRWERYGLTPGIALEIGCGAGRMTRPMASTFQHVHGVDVSPGMLRRAKVAVDGLPATLHEVDGLHLPLEDGSVDAVFSTHVFQHLDTLEDAEANWREVARVLRPGGSAMVHLPVHLWPGGLERLQAVYELRRMIGDLRARFHRRRMERDPHAAPIMRGQCYEWDALEATLQRLGMIDIELLLFRVRTNGGPHSCVLARRG